MLYHKDDIKYDRHDTQHPLYYVEAATAEGGLSLAHSSDNILKNREKTSSEVQHDVCDRPSDSALSLPVEVDLFSVYPF